MKIGDPNDEASFSPNCGIGPCRALDGVFTRDTDAGAISGSVAHQSFAPHVVGAFDAHAGVEDEPVTFDGDRWLAGYTLVAV